VLSAIVIVGPEIREGEEICVEAAQSASTSLRTSSHVQPRRPLVCLEVPGRLVSGRSHARDENTWIRGWRRPLVQLADSQRRNAF